MRNGIAKASIKAACKACTAVPGASAKAVPKVTENDRLECTNCVETDGHGHDAAPLHTVVLYRCRRCGVVFGRVEASFEVRGVQGPGQSGGAA